MAQKQVAEIRQAHSEAAADFEATKERLRRNHTEELERARREIATDMFEVADNLDRVLATVGETVAPGALVDGLKMVRDQFFSTLEKFGVRRSNPFGLQFDPTQHNAISVIPVHDPAKDGIVVEVLKPGYHADSYVLRAAQVVVGKHQDISPNG